jgi:prepilin-type N-terminal cleavage/methylation domain-containing protein
MQTRVHNQDAQAARTRRGFTMVELLFAVALSTLVMAGAATAFVWSLRVAAQCREYAWSQTEAIRSAQQIVSRIRNGTTITNMDLGGEWVEIVMPPAGRVARFTYSNPSGQVGDGRLVYIPDVSASSTVVVATGLTKVMTPPVRNIFERTGSDSLRMAYRITRPTDRGQYPSEIDIGVRLRNAN